MDLKELKKLADGLDDGGKRELYRQFHNSAYTLETFLQEMFISHDKHHEEQIMKHLQTLK